MKLQHPDFTDALPIGLTRLCSFFRGASNLWTEKNPYNLIPLTRAEGRNLILTQDEFNTFCAALPHTSHVVQWGGSDVWKVGKPGKGTNKVFCVAGWEKNEGEFAVSFKVSEIAFEMLRDTPRCRPAPYLAARGMTWIQRMTDEGVSDEDLKDYLRNSHRLVSYGLTKKLQKELGLNQEGGS